MTLIPMMRVFKRLTTPIDLHVYSVENVIKLIWDPVVENYSLSGESQQSKTNNLAAVNGSALFWCSTSSLRTLPVCKTVPKKWHDAHKTFVSKTSFIQHLSI